MLRVYMGIPHTSDAFHNNKNNKKSPVFSNPSTLSHRVLKKHDCWAMTFEWQHGQPQSHSLIRPALVTVNPLPLPCVTFPTPITDPHQPHGPVRLSSHTGTGSRWVLLTWWTWYVGDDLVGDIDCKLYPEWVRNPGEAKKDIRAMRDNSRAAAETKRGSVTAEGSFIRMHGSIVHLHKDLQTLGVNFAWHAATNFRIEAFYVAITPIHSSLKHGSPPFLLTGRELSHWLRTSST